jgi:hypothetical protein
MRRDMHVGEDEESQAASEDEERMACEDEERKAVILRHLTIL